MAHLEPEVTERRLARQWATIERRLPRPSSSRLTVPRILAFSVPGIAACVWLLAGGHVQRPASGALIESSDTPVSVQLRDGSSVELAAQTRMRVLRDQPSQVDIEVAAGRASFDVTHVPGRTFSVHAGVVSVGVVGTRFDVVKAARREGMEIEVVVKRGVVEVRRSDRDGDVRRLTAGETWSAWIAAPSTSSSAQLSEAKPAPPAQRAPKLMAAKVPSALPNPPARAQRPAAPISSSASGEPQRALENVRSLFSRANVARRAGRLEEAANAYAEVLRRFPHDSRAAVSAFELGRIRMDALGDPRAAAQAFQQSLMLSRHMPYREDALARLVFASDATGDMEACRKARAAYLAEYPTGVHVQSLAARCRQPPR